MRRALRPAIRRAMVVAATLAVAACQVGPRPLMEGWAAPRGDWTIVSQVAPGIAAMSPVEASQYVGRTISFGPHGVVSGGDRCPKPTYIVNLVYAPRYLARQYGMSPSYLGLYAHQDVKVTEVFCEGRKWPGLGGYIVWADDERGYAIRDGIWFELRRSATQG